jgi:hypothetical protein
MLVLAAVVVPSAKSVAVAAAAGGGGGGVDEDVNCMLTFFLNGGDLGGSLGEDE